MNWRPPTLQELKEGLSCEIIDLRACHENFIHVEEIKKHFKKDVAPDIIYKSHVLTARDVEYYTENQNLISRDLRILDSSPS